MGAYREWLIETVAREVSWAQDELLRERFEWMAVFAEYRVYWHSDAKTLLNKCCRGHKFR
jgi:hypothetical protein